MVHELRKSTKHLATGTVIKFTMLLGTVFETREVMDTGTFSGANEYTQEDKGNSIDGSIT